MKLTNYEWWRAGKLGTRCWIVLGLLAMTLALETHAQGVSTTTVQGTVYLANGQPGAGTLVASWPAFTTATGQAVAADQLTVTIPPDGFVSVNLAPNVGALPAGQYYTAVFYMSDGTVSTQYWQVPAAAQASLAQVQTQVMPAAQAVQAVSKTYVDQSITELSQRLLTASGGTLTGPLTLNADPTQALQAATKHYVDTQVETAVPLAGGNMTGALGTPALNGVESPEVGSSQTTLQAAINAAGTHGAMEIPPTYSGTDTFTNSNGVKVTDLRTTGAQQAERSVKEFGAVCDGVTDDTNALQTALSYANTHSVALTIPEGTCKTQTLNWHGESIGGLGKQVSALQGFPGQDVLASTVDSPSLLQYTRLHDLTIYVDQSLDVSCAGAKGRAAAGTCNMSRPLETNSIFSTGGNGLAGTSGTGAAWSVGNCAIAMPAGSGNGGNGLRVAEIENLEIATTGVDPMAAQYAGAHSTHTCGIYLAQWPQWSEFRNIDIRGLNTGIAIPALPVATPAGLNADSNQWQNVTIQATHAFTAAAGSNNVLDNVVAVVGNSSATGEPPTGVVLDFAGSQQGWTVRNAVVVPTWNAVQPALTVTTAGGAVTAVAVGTEHGLGWDPYGTSVPLVFSGSCTAQATATVNSNGSIGTVNVTQSGVGCSATTTASVNAAGTWDTAAPVNLISGQEMTFFAGNLLKGKGGYTVWSAQSAQSVGTQLSGGGGALPGGGSYPALVATTSLGSTLEVDQFPGADFGAKLQACLGVVSENSGGTCDARNFTGTVAMGSNLTISTGNTTVLLPCATISTASQIVVTAGTRNVALRGCALRGGSSASGSQGGSAFAYSGTGAMVQVGDPTYAMDTPGFHLDNVVINTTAATSAGAEGFIAYRTQELDLESLYLLGNGNQTAITLDGTGNYTGGTFLDNEISGFQTAINAIGHQVANPATTDWMNASTFVRIHIDCPTSSGNPISGTIGINLQQGDGNTFTGGDVEGCSTALHLGPNAQNNTIMGLRNENSTSQVVADAGSAYNNWMTGGTMFTGKLTDNGERNSFLDTFHRSFNGLNGDWYGSQQDATVTNHYRLGIGTGNERGLETRYQTDFGYRWTTGLSDATSGEQFYEVLDELNNVYRLDIGQYNNGQSSTNNQTVINAAGTGAVVLNGSNNSGTGGLVIGSGSPSETTVATISNAGNAQFNGTLQVGSTAQSAGTITVRNNADAEVDYYLWPGLTASQKGAFTYKDWNGNSQWYLVKDASNNWSVNSAIGGLDSFKAYQSTNGGDTYVNAGNSTGHIRLNYESGSGTETDIYSGSSSNLDAAFLGPTSIKFPGLAAASGYNCLQVDDSGYITHTGTACGSGSGSGTVDSGNTGQIAFYSATGNEVVGESTVPITAGGTGATSAPAALANMGGVAASGGTMTGALTAPQFYGPLSGNVIGNVTGNLTGNVTGNAITATALAATPAQCSGNNYATGVAASGAANCAQVSYAQIGGTTPTWNQNTTGTAGNVTGTVLVANGGTGATTAAAAVANLLPGVSTYASNGVGVAGNAQVNGTLQVGETSTFTGSTTVMNQANAEIDSILQAGSTASQKESFLYKDYNGNNQWYLVKDSSNNWAINSAIGGLDSFKAFQSSNSGDTYIDSSNSTGHIRMNYESGSGAETDIYSGGGSNLVAAFSGTTSIKFPGLAAGTGYNCLQVDNSGYVTNTGSACGSGSGASGTINSGNTGQIAYYASSGSVVGGESTVPVTSGGTGAATAAAAVANLLPGVASDGSNGVAIIGNVGASSTTAKTIGGFEYASQYQTGGGNNGIANASSGGTNQIVVADPSYATTEEPVSSLFTANGFTFEDLRGGAHFYYYHNPNQLQNPWNLYEGFQGGPFEFAQFDGLSYGSNAGTGGTYNTLNNHAFYMNSTTPGWDLGNGVANAGEGWLIHVGLSFESTINSSGIAEGLSMDCNKMGLGDNACLYSVIDHSHNGWTDPSGEGVKPIAGKLDEDTATYTGTIHSGGTTGSTALVLTPVTDSGYQGTGQYVIDTAQSPVTCKFTAIGSGLGGGSAITMSGCSPSLTESVAWGTVTAAVLTPVNSTTSPFSTSETFLINIVGGTGGSGGQYDTVNMACWGGAGGNNASYHDCAKPTFAGAVDSGLTCGNSGTVGAGQQCVTMPLRKPHSSGSYLFQGGMAGYGFEAVSYDSTPNGQPLRYLLDVAGSTSSNVLQVVFWQQGSAHQAPLPNNSYDTFNVSSGVTNGGSGTTVTFSWAGTGTLYHPYLYNLSTIIFAGLSDSALNTSCTGVVWTSNQSGGTCTIAGLSGSHTDSTGGTASLGLNGAKLWPMAETINVECETCSPPSLTDSNGYNYFALEPNIIAFANNDTVEQTHHASADDTGETIFLDTFDPYSLAGGLTVAWTGTGAQNGSFSASSNAMVNIANENPDSLYTGSGGSAAAPNMLNEVGSYSYGINVGEGPTTGDAFINIDPTGTQIADLNYCFPVWNVYDASGANYDQTCPYTGNQTRQVVGLDVQYSPTGHNFTGSPLNVVSEPIQISGNTVLPNTLTGYHGNSSGVKVQLATNWTNTAGAIVCDDGNGNLTVSSCHLNYTQLTGTVPTWNQNTTGNATTATSASEVNGGSIPNSAARLATNSSGQIVAAANTLGCLDGYDHLPCTVYVESNVSESSATASYSTVWTSTNAGVYRVNGYIYGTTASSTAYTVSNYVKATQTGQSAGNGYQVGSAQIGTSISSGDAYSYVFPLAASTPVQTESLTSSGSNTGGAWSRGIVIERLQ